MDVPHRQRPGSTAQRSPSSPASGRSSLERLVTIPGISRPAAEVIVAEGGVDMTSFPTAGHICSWAGMAPGNHQGAGKRRSGGGTSKANRRVAAAAAACAAWAASHARGTVFEATYRRWAKRMGRKRVLVGVGHKVLKVIHEVPKGPMVYQERLRPEKAA